MSETPPPPPSAAPPGGGAPPAGAPPAGAPGEQRSSAVLWLVIAGALIFGCLVCGGILAALLTPALVKARAAVMDGMAQAHLRQLCSAEESYRVEHGRYASSLAELEKTGHIAPDAFEDTRLRITILAPAADGEGFSISAVPAEASPSRKCFYVDQTGVMRWRVSTEGPASARDPEVPRGR